MIKNLFYNLIKKMYLYIYTLIRFYLTNLVKSGLSRFQLAIYNIIIKIINNYTKNFIFNNNIITFFKNTYNNSYIYAYILSNTINLKYKLIDLLAYILIIIITITIGFFFKYKFFSFIITFNFCYIDSFIYSYMDSLLYSYILSFIHSIIDSFIYSLNLPFNLSFIHSYIDSFIDSFDYSYIYSLNLSFNDISRFSFNILLNYILYIEIVRLKKNIKHIDLFKTCIVNVFTIIFIVFIKFIILQYDFYLFINLFSIILNLFVFIYLIKYDIYIKDRYPFLYYLLIHLSLILLIYSLLNFVRYFLCIKSNLYNKLSFNGKSNKGKEKAIEPDIEEEPVNSDSASSDYEPDWQDGNERSDIPRSDGPSRDYNKLDNSNLNIDYKFINIFAPAPLEQDSDNKSNNDIPKKKRIFKPITQEQKDKYNETRRNKRKFLTKEQKDKVNEYKRKNHKYRPLTREQKDRANELRRKNKQDFRLVLESIRLNIEKSKREESEEEKRKNKK